MSKAASRLHATGGILFLVTGAAHTLGQFTSGASDPGSRAVEEAMRKVAISGTSFTYWNVMQCWGALYGAMTMLFGALLLSASRSAPGDPRVRRATAIVGALAAILQAGVALVYRTPPPVFFMVPAAVVLVLAAALPERNTP